MYGDLAMRKRETIYEDGDNTCDEHVTLFETCTYEHNIPLMNLYANTVLSLLIAECCSFEVLEFFDKHKGLYIAYCFFFILEHELDLVTSMVV
jgi:hypothetical protein